MHRRAESRAGDTGSFIQHKATGRNIKLHKKGNVFKDLEPSEENTAEDQDNAKVLGELGFARQEDD